MQNHWLFWLCLACLVGLALVYDIVQRRIPNWLVLAGLLAGAGFALLTGQAHAGLGLGKSLLGALTGLAVMLPLYFLRAMGAGDAKLMAAIGAFLGPLQILGAALLTFVAGGLLSIIAALGSGSLSRVLGNLRLMGMIAVSGRSAGVSLKDVPTTGRLPYAIAIAAGTALQVWLAAQGNWVLV